MKLCYKIRFVGLARLSRDEQKHDKHYKLLYTKNKWVQLSAEKILQWSTKAQQIMTALRWIFKNWYIYNRPQLINFLKTATLTPMKLHITSHDCAKLYYSTPTTMIDLDRMYNTLAPSCLCLYFCYYNDVSAKRTQTNANQIRIHKYIVHM
jgi:hypothetical protein